MTGYVHECPHVLLMVLLMVLTLILTWKFLNGTKLPSMLSSSTTSLLLLLVLVLVILKTFAMNSQIAILQTGLHTAHWRIGNRSPVSFTCPLEK